MEKFKKNPFDRSALTDVKLLAGRSSEMRQIRFILKNASRELNRIKHILITGNRGVGKTSFLNLIENECQQNNIIPIRINLTESNSCNSNDFFWNIFYQTVNTMFDLDLLGGKGGIIDSAIQSILHSDGLKDQANWIFRTPLLRKNYLANNNLTFEFDLLINDLKLIRKEVIDSKKNNYDEKTKLLFLVDETQHIYSNSQIIEDIRFIIQHPDLGIGFVFAGDASYETLVWESIFGGSHRDFEIINLAYFNDIESIKDYFTKSLESIGWSSEEIEKNLFYRFSDACREIFNLTSGKPSWINTIAMKMFERCMKGDSKQLRFDKQAQNDVKVLLEKSGQLDTSKVDLIDSFEPKLQKWLSEIFFSELWTLNQIYFYSKFKLIENNFLDKSEYKIFCTLLLEKQIVFLLDEDLEDTIGYRSKQKDILDRPFLAFGPESDTIKQWLQISSNGKYSFSSLSPEFNYFRYLNKQLVCEFCNIIIRSDSFSGEEEIFRLSNELSKIETKTIDIIDLPYDDVSFIYKCCKKLSISRDRQILHGQLIDNKAGKIRSWDALNYDDHEKTVGFLDMPKKIERFKQVVESYMSNDHNFILELNIDLVDKPDINKLQELIIKSKDKKKIDIILDDKGKEMADSYIKASNLETSYRNANFLYELFEKDIDIEANYLNNSAYVFISKNDLKKAHNLLSEALRKTSLEDPSIENANIKCLIIYNWGILYCKEKNYSAAKDSFERVMKLFQEIDNIDDTAAVLNILKLNENNEILIDEIKDDGQINKQVRCSNFAEINLTILNSIL